MTLQEKKSQLQLSLRNEEEQLFYIERLKELNSQRTTEWTTPQKEALKAVFQEGKLNHFWRKGRKGGGTEPLGYAGLRIAGCQKNKLVYLVYPNNRAIQDIWKSTNRLAAQIPQEWDVKWTWTEKAKKLYFPLTESTMEFRSADDPKQMQGWECDLLIFDELADIKEASFEIAYPNRGPRNAIVIMCGAPPVETSNYYWRYDDEAMHSRADWSHFIWNRLTNPYNQDNFDYEKELERHKRMGQLDFFMSQIMAQRVVGGSRSVLKGFAKENNIIKDRVLLEKYAKNSDKYKWFTLFDPGYGSCFAVLIGCFDPSEGVFVIFREIYERDKNEASARKIWKRCCDLRESIKTNSPVQWIYLFDGQAKGFGVELRDVAGDIPLQKTFKQNADEEKYFRMWNELCLDKQYLVSDECTSHIRECLNYITDVYGRFPDRENHTLDLGRYIIKYLEHQIPRMARVKYDDLFTQPKTRREAIDAWEGVGSRKKKIIDWPFL